MALTDAQYAAFIDRLIACREAEDATKADTKQVYSELADAGEDKTAAGLIVRGLRMTAKDRTEANLREAAVEDALERYNRGKASHVRARESEPEHDAATKAKRAAALDALAALDADLIDADGVIIEPEAAMLPQTVGVPAPIRASAEQAPVESSATDPVAKAGDEAEAGAIGAFHDARADVATTADVEPVSRVGSGRTLPATSDYGRDSQERLATISPSGSGAGTGDAGEANQAGNHDQPASPASNPVTIPPASPLTAEVTASADRSAVLTLAAAPVGDRSNVTVLRTHNPETHFLNSKGLPRLHGCLKPETCASEQASRKLCFSCSVKHDGPAYQAEAAE